ncbi:MAG: hypothetical protein N2446_03145 [Elusimicrobiales bacterium]|nr:hypothetical protein [Elusimicrobiales bacterium]
MIFLYIFIIVFVVWYFVRKNIKENIYFLLTNVKKGATKTPEDFYIPYEPIYFDTYDGIELSGWFVESVKETDSIFIICGDGFNIKSDLLEDTLFLRENYNLFYFDFRGTGTSKGKYKFGFEEHKDIEAAYKFLKENKTEFSNNVFIYLCGFSAFSIISVSNFEFSGGVFKKPVFFPFKEIKKIINSKIKILIAYDAIDEFFSMNISYSFSDPKKINYPVIFISDKKYETSSKSISVKNNDEFRKVVFDFFKY